VTLPESDDQTGEKARPASLVGRIVRTLELLAGSPLGAAQVGRELGTNRSTALRLLAELVDTGYVLRDPETKRYTIATSKLLALVPSPRVPHDWSQAVNPFLEAIRDHTGDSAILSVPAELNMMYLASYPTTHVVSVLEGVGTMRPMQCSAQGKAYMSALPADELDSLVDTLAYGTGSHLAAKTPRELRMRVEQARKDGYALDLEETYEGVRCVAVPLRIRGSLVGAIGITGPTGRMGVGRLRELGGYLKARAAEIDAGRPPGV